MEKYYLMALDENGKEYVYTGKSGDGWVSENRSDLFHYNTREVAQHKAALFNRMTAIHGLRFIALLD